MTLGLDQMYRKIVGKRSPRRDLTLRAMCDTVHVICTILIQAMPMERSRLISQVVLDVYYQAVTNIHVNLGNWPFAVYANDWAIFLAIGISDDPADGKVVGTCLCRDKRRQE